jgi:hypothetical protein
MDPLAAVFVFCFVFGVATSLLSLALGALQGGGGDGGHSGHAVDGDPGGLHLGGEGGGDGGHALAHAGAASGGENLHVDLAEGQGGQVSPFNLQTISTFLAFFGGSGWVLYSSVGLAPALALIVATVIGVAGGAVVFLFLVKVLLASQRFMDPASSRMEGTVARVSMAIRADGTGEIVFSRDGTRRSEGARSATGAPIAAGTEVVIVRYDRGLAYVEPWASYVGEG